MPKDKKRSTEYNSYKTAEQIAKLRANLMAKLNKPQAVDDLIDYPCVGLRGQKLFGDNPNPTLFKIK